MRKYTYLSSLSFQGTYLKILMCVHFDTRENDYADKHTFQSEFVLFPADWESTCRTYPLRTPRYGSQATTAN